MRKPRRRAQTWAIRVAVGMVALFAAYLVAANVLVGTTLLPRLLNGHPDALRVDYASAWSLYPGHVRAKGLSIRGKDSNVEWLLELDDVTFSVAWTELFHQRFHARGVRARGVWLWLRRRVPAADATPE